MMMTSVQQSISEQALDSDWSTADAEREWAGECMGVQNQEWQGGERGEVEARTKRGTPLWSRKRRKDIKGRKKKTAETYFYIVLQLNLGWIPWHWQELYLAIGVIISTQFRVVPSVQSIFVILGTDCKDGRSVPVICHSGRKVSHLHTYSPYLLCVLSSNLFDSPSSCVYSDLSPANNSHSDIQCSHHRTLGPLPIARGCRLSHSRESIIYPRWWSVVPKCMTYICGVFLYEGNLH